jgi:hypothetical protein
MAMPDGELRRSLVAKRKDRAAAHVSSLKHVFTLSQDEDPGFPAYHRPTKRELSPGHVIQMMIHATAEIAGKLDIPVNVVVTRSFHNYLIAIMGYAIYLTRIAPGINIDQAPPEISHGRMSCELRDCGRVVYDDRLHTIRENHRFVDLICDAETVLTRKVVQSALSNP